MKKWRNSALRLRAECGWAYKEAYIDSTPPLPSPILHGGQNVHAAVRAVVHELVNGADFLNIHEIAFRTVRGSHLEYYDALQVLTLFQEELGQSFNIDPKAVFLVEEALEMPLVLSNGQRDVVYWGTPDLGERVSKRRCRITDWKTDHVPWPRHIFMANKQLPRYCLLVHEHYPKFTEFECVVRFARFRNHFHTRVITVDELPVIRNELIAEIEATEERDRKGDYEPTPGAWCALCTHTHTCPIIADLRRHRIDDLSIPDDARATQLAGEVVALEAWTRAVKSRLRAYLSQHPQGFVQLAGGSSVGFGPQSERFLPAKDLKRTAKQKGAEVPDWVFRTDLKKVDQWKNRLPDDIAAAIDSVTVERTTSDFRYRRVPDPRVRKKKKRESAAQEAIFESGDE